MAIGWMTALKMVPWSDVIENAPLVVNGAKKLFTKTRAEAPAAPPVDTPPADPKAAIDPDARLTRLADTQAQAAARIATLESESREMAALIESLAEQQKQVIGAVDALGKRTSALTVTVIALVIVCAGLIVALVLR